VGLIKDSADRLGHGEELGMHLQMEGKDEAHPFSESVT